MERFNYYFQRVLWEAYQQYLKDSPEESSLRGFAKKLDLNSGTLSLIFKGQRSLNNATAKKVADRLELNLNEKKLFFRSIILYKARDFYDHRVFPIESQENAPAKIEISAQERTMQEKPQASPPHPKELEWAFHNIEKFDPWRSEFSSNYIRVDPHLILEAKEAISNFKNEMQLLFQKAPSSEMYLLCIQFFPTDNSGNNEK